MNSWKNLTLKKKSLVLGVLFLVLLSWLNVLDDLSKDFLNDSITQAGLAFGSAKLINASVSVMQSFSVDFGLSISPGEVLDPVNDMVEDFSTLMKYAIGSLLLQKILAEIVSLLLFKILFTIAAIVMLVYMLIPKLKYQQIAVKSFITFVALRFAVLLLVIVNSIASQLFIDERIEQDIEKLNASSAELSELQGGDKQIPDDIRIQLERDIKVRNNKILELKDDVSEIDKDIKEIEAEQARLKDLYSNIPIQNKFFSKTDEAIKLNEGISAADTEIKMLERKRDDKLESLEVMHDEIDVLSRQLRGESSFFEGIGNAVSDASAQFIKFKNMLTYEALKNTIGSTIDAMLGAMIPFILKTLLLPLLFIVGLIRLFKVLWNIDLKEKAAEVRKDLEEIVEELTKKSEEDDPMLLIKRKD